MHHHLRRPGMIYFYLLYQGTYSRLPDYCFHIGFRVTAHISGAILLKRHGLQCMLTPIRQKRLGGAQKTAYNEASTNR